MKKTLCCFLLCIGVSGCVSSGINNGSTIKPGGEEVFKFDTLMEQLGNGLNKLHSNNSKNYLLAADGVTVTFNLVVTDKDTLSISNDFNISAGGTQKIENYTIEKNQYDDKTIAEFINTVNSTSSDSSNSNTTEDDGSNSSSSTDSINSSDKSTNRSDKNRSGSDEFKDALNQDLTASISNKLSASYSSVETGDGKNTITISFKSILNYPTEKIKLIAKLGFLGCIPFYVENINAPLKLDDNGKMLMAKLEDAIQDYTKLDPCLIVPATESDGGASTDAGALTNPG